MDDFKCAPLVWTQKHSQFQIKSRKQTEFEPKTSPLCCWWSLKRKVSSSSSKLNKAADCFADMAFFVASVSSLVFFQVALHIFHNFTERCVDFVQFLLEFQTSATEKSLISHFFNHLFQNLYQLFPTTLSTLLVFSPTKAPIDGPSHSLPLCPVLRSFPTPVWGPQSLLCHYCRYRGCG